MADYFFGGLGAGFSELGFDGLSDFCVRLAFPPDLVPVVGRLGAAWNSVCIFLVQLFVVSIMLVVAITFGSSLGPAIFGMIMIMVMVVVMFVVKAIVALCASRRPLGRIVEL